LASSLSSSSLLGSIAIVIVITSWLSPRTSPVPRRIAEARGAALLGDLEATRRTSRRVSEVAADSVPVPQERCRVGRRDRSEIASVGRQVESTSLKSERREK
jgi:hypothetical protein